MTEGLKPLRVGMVGYAFMGAAHSVGWRQAPRVFELPLHVQMTALAGRTEDAVTRAADRLGWSTVETDWRALIERDDIDLIDICTPGDSHAQIAIAALEAGKHVVCEKPLANTVEEARAMAEAADAAAARGQIATVGFNYRRLPAMALAHDWIAAGRLGTIRHVRAAYLQDWIVDPQFPLVWRLRREAAGSGALGDIGAHIIDLAQYLVGSPISGVSGLTETFIKRRPVPEAASGLSGQGGQETGEVTVDDAALFLARFDGGALGTFEATRFATGRKNALRLEINGSDGSIAFDLEALNELHYYDNRQPATEAGFRRILVTEPDHPYVSAWWPPGHGLGYEHSFVHEVRDLVVGIAQGRPVSPTFAEGLQVQRVLDAVTGSATNASSWQEV